MSKLMFSFKNRHFFSLMRRQTERRRVLQPVVRQNTIFSDAVKTRNCRISLPMNKLVQNSRNEEVFETEEDMFEAAMRWDETQREAVIENQKKSLIQLRDELFNEKKRILMKETEIEAKKIQLNGLSDTYNVIKQMLDGEIEANENQINEVMSGIVYPEDSLEEREDYINQSLFEIAYSRPKPLPDIVLSMSSEDFEEFKAAYEEEERNSHRYLVPSDDSVYNGSFDLETVSMYKNWLNALADEVDILLEKEPTLDQTLSEVDFNINSISSYISLGLKCLAFVPTGHAE